MAADISTTGPWNTRPVFISSTFKDMQAERDHLRHVVFPRLEEELRKGRLLLEPIDLRQGVETAEVADEDKRELLVLKVCLDEIQRSRPFLIVLLGDRYGWVPPEERMKAATQEVGFAVDVADKSVTTLEIEFGILRQSPEQRHRSFFYFREPLPYSKMPEKLRAEYSDEYSTDPQTRARHSRLKALRKALADNPEIAPRVHNYRADWDDEQNKVTGLETWGEQVYQHLLGELQAEIEKTASQPPQTWEDQERASLAEFIEHRRRDFTGRKQLLDELTNIALSPTPADAVFALASGVTWGACVTGEPGSGKSAMFAELVARLSADDSILVLAHAAGATPRGSQVGAMLDRFIQELAASLGIANPLPENATPDDVDATFASLLGRVAVKRRVVVLLDAINQFDAIPRAQYLTWLRPKLWHANARIITTGLPCEAAVALSQWAGIEELEVPPLTITHDDTDDVTAIAQAVWKRYHRQVNPAVLRVLKEKHLPDGKFAAGNPLWLTLALEQINLLDADDFARAERDFADRPAHERVTALLIDTAQQLPPTVVELYDKLLAQSERNFGVAATRAFAAVIAVSRFGWRDTDFLDLIPSAASVLCPDDPIPQPDDLQLATLRRSFRAHLARRGELEQLDFFHAQMREAVERRVLGDAKQAKVLHRTIAAYLGTLPLGDPLRDSELMVHLIAGDDARRAARVYADLPEPSSALTAATQTLAKHVIRGAKNEPNANAAWVATLLTQPGLTSAQVANLAHRCNFNLHDALANTANLATRESLLQATCGTWQRLTESDPENAEWLRELSVSISRLGELAIEQGNLPDVQQMFDKSHHIRLRLTQSDPSQAVWQHDLSVSTERLGDLATAQGNLLEAQRLFGESLRIRQRLAESDPTNAVWQRDLAVSLERLGSGATAQGNLPEAQRLLGESLRIRKQLAESDPANAESQFNLGISNERLGDLATALGNLDEAGCFLAARHETIQRLAESAPANATWQRDLSVSLNKLGDMATAQGNLPEAWRWHGEAHRIALRLAESDPANAAWQRDLSVSLEKLGDLATSQGNLLEAQRLFGDSYRIKQRLAESDPANVEWQFGLGISNERLGDFAMVRGDLDDASRYHSARHEIIQRLGESDPTNAAWQRDLSVSYIKLGHLAAAQRNLPKAHRLFGESHCVVQRLAESDPTNVAWQRDLSVSLERLGDLVTEQGNLLEAQRLHGESHRIAQRLAESDPMNAAWQSDLAVSLGKLGDLATARGNLPEAQRLFGEALRIRQRMAESDPTNAAWQRDLSVSLERLGNVAKSQGNLTEAQWLFGEALRTLERLAESDPANAAWQSDLGISNERLGDVAIAQGDLATAHTHYSAKRTIIQRLAESDPMNAAWQSDLAVSLNKLGHLATAQGNLLEAQRLFGDAILMRQRLAESDPANAGWQRDLYVSFINFGDLATAQGNLPEAKWLLGEALRIAQWLAESDPANAAWQRDLSVSLNKLGELATAQGHLAEAQRLFSECQRTLQRLADSDPANAEWQRDLAVLHYQLAKFSQQSGDNVGFHAELQQCYFVLEQMRGRGLHFDPQLAQVYQQLAGMFGG